MWQPWFSVQLIGSPIQNFQNAFKKCSIMNFHALGIFPEISSRCRENHYK